MKKIQKCQDDLKVEINVNIVKLEGPTVVKTVVENDNVKVVITKNDLKKYLNQRYGRSE